MDGWIANGGGGKGPGGCGHEWCAAGRRMGRERWTSLRDLGRTLWCQRAGPRVRVQTPIWLAAGTFWLLLLVPPLLDVPLDLDVLLSACLLPACNYDHDDEVPPPVRMCFAKRGNVSRGTPIPNLFPGATVPHRPSLLPMYRDSQVP